MSRELIATDKNPYGGIKKKKSPPRPSPVCLSRCTLIILNKPGAAQLTIRKPCLQARGIRVSSHYHCRLHVLPVLAPQWRFEPVRESRLWKAEFQPSSGAMLPEVPLAPGHIHYGFFFQQWDFCGARLLFPSWCYLLRGRASSWHCFSPQRGKVRLGNDECLASW